MSEENIEPPRLFTENFERLVYEPSQSPAYQAVVNAIVNDLGSPDSGSAMMALFGDWGTGKSSMLEIVKNRTEATKPKLCDVYVFDTWRHQNSPNIVVSLIDTIVRRSRKEDEIDDFGEWEWWVDPHFKALCSGGPFRAIDAMASAMVSASTVTLETGALFSVFGQAGIQINGEAALKRYKEVIKEQTLYVEDQLARVQKFESASHEIETLFAAIRAFRLGNGRPANLCIVVDDADRCKPEVLLGIVEAFWLLKKQSWLRLLFPVDKQAIRAAVKNRYTQFGEEDIDRFIEKVFYPTYDLKGLGHEDYSSILTFEKLHSDQRVVKEVLVLAANLALIEFSGPEKEHHSVLVRIVATICRIVFPGNLRQAEKVIRAMRNALAMHGQALKKAAIHEDNKEASFSVIMAAVALTQLDPVLVSKLEDNALPAHANVLYLYTESQSLQPNDPASGNRRSRYFDTKSFKVDVSFKEVDVSGRGPSDTPMRPEFAKPDPDGVEFPFVRLCAYIPSELNASRVVEESLIRQTRMAASTMLECRDVLLLG